MSSNDEISSISGPDLDGILLEATERGDAETVQQALQNGANVNVVTVSRNWYDMKTTPLFRACERGSDEIVRILLDAGADAWWRRRDGWSAMLKACSKGDLSTVQLLVNHDSGLLEMASNVGSTPLFCAVNGGDEDVVRELLDCGANPHHVDQSGATALMYACRRGSLDNARLLLAAGVDVDARDGTQQTALHHAIYWSAIEVVCELIFQHKANIFAAKEDGQTPFDLACNSSTNSTAINPLLESYGNRLTQDHGRLALHELLKVSEYSFAEDEEFHPPLNPLRIILPLGKLKLKHWQTLLHSLDTEVIHSRDDTGKLPIHIACQTNAPVEVLAILVEIDSATLHMADHSGSLPVHLCCSGAVECSSLWHLLAQSGVGTLAARNRQGALPLHVLCGSTNPTLRTLQYLIQSFPESVAMRTIAGEYPFMIAAASDSSGPSLMSVVYELVRTNPGVVVPK